MPSNYSIFNYWKNEMLFDEPVIADWAEPECWCCKKAILVETETARKDGDFKYIWNKTSEHLQRCHIVPKSLEGSNAPNNLFLLCPSCHEQAPNSDNRDIFLRWIYFERKKYAIGWNLQKLLDTAKYLCQQSDVDFDEFIRFFNNLGNSKLDSKHVSTHLSKLTESTVIMMLIERFKAQNSLVFSEVAVSVEP
jgi:hypothetical protein